jgi:SAM-dependent methyltransferase
MNSDMHDYFSGKLLYGDDFSSDEIIDWFKDEEEGYADLGAKDEAKYTYGYHKLNFHHGFRFFRGVQFQEVLGFGSAYGDELLPIIDNIHKITILDPSDAFSNVKEVMKTPCDYIKPNASGLIPFANNQFDLITCLGVMHHIPNISYVMSECYRCLNRNGIMLLREPIISMGDWRKPRRGLTKRERGIPLDILDNIVSDVGFSIKNRSMCNYPLIPKIANKLGVAAYNNYPLTIADALLSQLFSYKIKYHRTKIYEKLAPASVYYVLEKKP